MRESFEKNCNHDRDQHQLYQKCLKLGVFVHVYCSVQGGTDQVCESQGLSEHAELEQQGKRITGPTDEFYVCPWEALGYKACVHRCGNWELATM